MRLTAITLENFRCFESLHVDLNENLIVLIAPNGAGKTAVLDAIRIALWPYVHSFDLATTGFNDPANTISIDDVLQAQINESQIARILPSKISVSGDVLGVNTWMRWREKESVRSQTIEDINSKNLRKRAKKIQEQVRSSSEPSIDLPVIGYYGTGRLWSNKKLKNKEESRTEMDSASIRTYAYRDCLDPASSYRAFERWFIRTNNSNLSELVKLHKQKNEIKFDAKTKFSDQIEVVNRAINAVLEDYEDLELNFEQKLVIYNIKTGLSLKIEQLSDGVRNIIGMVADIAYRCYQLNPHLGESAAMDARGVILIDEIDMHLHPRWQQTIIGSLMRAFPNIQFIVTTHSPQVLTTLNSKYIRILGKDHEGRDFSYEPHQQTIGVESASVLLNLMGVSSIPPVEEAKLVDQYIHMIENGDYTTCDGLALREKLIKIYGANHSIILNADRLIRFQNFKKKKSR